MTETTNFEEISFLPSRTGPSGFAKALSVWINKPHVVNRRLCGTKIIYFDAVHKSKFNVEQVLKKLNAFGYQLSDAESDADNSVKDGNAESNAKYSRVCGEESRSITLESEVSFMMSKHADSADDNSNQHEGCKTDVSSIPMVYNNHEAERSTDKWVTPDTSDIGYFDTKNDNLERDSEHSSNAVRGTDHEFSLHDDTLMKDSVNAGDVINNLDHRDNVVNMQGYEKTLILEKQRDEKLDFNTQLRTSEVSDASGGFERNSLEDPSVSEVEGLADFGDDVIVIIRELVPKQPDRHKNIPELIIYEKSCETCTFYPIRRKQYRECEEQPRQIEIAYQFVLGNKARNQGEETSITMSVSCSSFSEDSRRKLSLTWLQGQLLPKIARWSEEPNLKTSLTSLKLVPLEEYNALYNKLKIKYGQHFAKIWPEKTDPQKYVFEDVAIATYLLLLWKQDRERKCLTKKQTFVDLGCGNGLLVHILASEGHPGYGVDVRKRNIWDLYGQETVLKEIPITPSRESLFPDSDWLIGNHSDELTPWIPVMAARSSYHCCYFVLPCCHHDFDTRFSQSVVGGSQYREYLNYIQTVGENCGFTVEEDMLRIPSTKRVCFVGRSRSYSESEEPHMDEKRTLFINSRCSQNKVVNNKSVINSASIDSYNIQEKTWSTDFAPRSKEEITRNCVTVRKETKEAVIRSVFEKLMSSNTCEVKQLENGKKWRKGGSMPISDVVKLFDASLLQELKSECGGIQTLLRNSSHIFQVSSGIVQLRDFTLDNPWGRKRKGKKTDSSDFVKTSLCWFNVNHPDGCPRASEHCSYAHSEDELRERPTKVKKLI